MLTLNINGQVHEIDADADMPLLWVLRDLLGLTGTKYGCGIAQCGVCTVLVDGAPIRSCTTPVATLIGRKIITIEGLSLDSSHPVQQAWLVEEVPQCGFCQSGQILAAASLLAKTPQPTDAEVDQAMAPMLCRCGTYPRIRLAIQRAAKIVKERTHG